VENSVISKWQKLYIEPSNEFTIAIINLLVRDHYLWFK